MTAVTQPPVNSQAWWERERELMAQERARIAAQEARHNWRGDRYRDSYQSAQFLDEVMLETDRRARLFAGGGGRVHLNRLRMEVEAELRRAAEARQATSRRTPGWRITCEPHQWPLYVTEAVTFPTPWGPVTVGRNLARIYDLDGWPDEETLRSMVEQQAEREVLR